MKLWDATTGRGLRTLVGHTQAVRGVLFTSDGLRLLSWGDDGVLRVWGPSGSVLAQPHRGVILSAAWAVDEGAVLFSAEENCVHRWDLGDDDDEFFAGDPARRTNALALLPGGRQMLLGCNDGAVRSQDLSGRRIEAEVARHRQPGAGRGRLARERDRHLGRVRRRHPPVRRRGQRGGRGLVRTCQQGAVPRIRPRRGPIARGLRRQHRPALGRQVAASPAQVFGGHAGAVRGVAISRDGRFAATAADDGAVRLWSLGEEATSVVCRDLDNNPNGRAFEGLDVAPDASAALSQRSEQGPQKLWDVRAGALVRTIEQGVPLFATDGRLLRLFRPPPDAPRGGACSCRTAAASSRRPRQHRLPLGRRHRPTALAAGRSTPARSTASRSARTGGTALTGSWDQTARYWDLEAARGLYAPRAHGRSAVGRHLARRETGADGRRRHDRGACGTSKRGVELRTFAGHQGHVIAVAFAGDGRTLLSADAGGVLRAWDGPTGHELGVFPLDTGSLQAAAFTPGPTAFVSR